MLLLRDLFAVFVLAKTSAAARVVDFKFDPSLQMPPLPDKFETYTVHTCLKSLENDPNVAFSADQVLSNEEDFPWASQGWSKVSRVWPQGVVEVFNASQKRIGGGLGGLGPDGSFVMATKEQMNASLKTLRRLIACCRRTNTLFTMRSGGHCNAGCSSMGGTMTFGIKGLNIVAPKDVAKDFTAWSLERPWESPGTVEVGAGADAGQAAYMTFNESFRHDPNHPKFRVANVPVGFAGGLPVGQKPTVGMAGLTLGGGFGFHTRYAGLLCDRLIALEAVNPDTAEIIHATKDNEHSELVWAACGGGGGNYAAVTKFTFQMMPICVVPSCTVIQLQHYMTQTLEHLLFFQEWSLKMDPRITANLEVANSTTVTIAGIWMGSLAEFRAALITSGLDKTTPFTLDELLASATEVEYTQALINLNGWNDVVQAAKYAISV